MSYTIIEWPAKIKMWSTKGLSPSKCSERGKEQRGKFRVPMKFKSSIHLLLYDIMILYDDQHHYHQHHLLLLLFSLRFFIHHSLPPCFKYTLLYSRHWPQFSFYLALLQLIYTNGGSDFFHFLSENAFLFYFCGTSAALLATLR